MLGRKIQHAIHMLVILHFRSLRDGKTNTGEDILYLLAHKRQRMTRTQFNRIRRARQVQTVGLRLFLLKLLTQGINPSFRLLTQLVQQLSQFPFLVVRHLAKLIEKRGNLTFLTEIFDTQRLELLRISSL